MSDEQKDIGKETPQPEIPAETDQAEVEQQDIVENKQNTEQDDTAALKEAIEKTDVDDSLKLQAVGHAQGVQDAPETERVKKLIDIAAVKGIAYAVEVAKKAGDAYLVDALHDALTEGEYYKKFKI